MEAGASFHFALLPNAVTVTVASVVVSVRNLKESFCAAKELKSKKQKVKNNEPLQTRFILLSNTGFLNFEFTFLSTSLPLPTLRFLEHREDMR